MNLHVLKAIFRRDFVNYFSSPTGYVFICVFVALCCLATFWPPEFFSSNLANLDQLSQWLPFILLVFIPAITMSIWAEERRQGTDELLLTIPASDADVVISKFLAGVAIYTVSLIYAMLCVYLIFIWRLGFPDFGIYFSTAIGYWFVGIAMLSIGMVASFLTSDLTIGFILGMLFNLPLALFGVADWVIKNATLAQTMKRWSALEQFRDFERGVIGLSSVTYFVMIVVAMVYLSIVMIGRRHWSGGADGNSMVGHYVIRALSLVALAIGVTGFFSNHEFIRVDVSSEGINSLSPDTIKLIKELAANDDVNPIKIDAYVSPQVPAEYAQQKINLLSTLDELKALSNNKIQVTINIIENFSEEATRAERTFGIQPRMVDTNVRGARTQQEIFLGIAFNGGLDKVVIPFLDRGIPIEYELVRSITTVAQQKRPKLAILKTDVQLFSGFSMQGPTEEARIVTELKKQYNVVEVDPAKPITELYDVMLAIQPSSLSPEAMGNFVAAVKRGQPTAIFEDPFPIPTFYPNVPGTAQPKQPNQQGIMGMMNRQQPQPKGDINQLWQLIGADIVGDELIWQDHNPYRKAESIVDVNWLFIDEANGAEEPFNPGSSISSNMGQILLLLSGAIRQDDNSKIDFLPLAVTGQRTGSISYSDLQLSNRTGGAVNRRIRTGETYVVAARLTGNYVNEDALLLDESLERKENINSETDNAEEAVEDKESDSKKATAGDTGETKIDVVLVADIDWISPIIFMLRDMGESDDSFVDWKFQNVSFVLNILDTLADDDRFVELRKRSRPHRILTKIEEATEEYHEDFLENQEDYSKDAKQQIAAVQDEFRSEIAKLSQQEGLDPRALEMKIDQVRISLGRSNQVKIARLEKERDRNIKLAERELALQVRSKQDFVKFIALFLPPIPPILLALAVFFDRRRAEREGVEKVRLRFSPAELEK